MKIAQIMGSNKEGGAELYFERLTSALIKTGEEILPVVRSNPARRSRFEAQDISIQELAFAGVFDFTTRRRLKNILDKFAPEIVFAWMNRAAYHTPSGPWVMVGRLGGYYDLKYYQRCDHLVANTPLIVKWIVQQGWPSERVHYLPNFVYDLKVHSQVKQERQKQKILSIGRLHINKAFDTLLHAMTALPDCELTISGEGPERPSLEKLIRVLKLEDRVHLLGWNSDIKTLFAECDVFVCPSRHEPLGNVMIEAFSAERPVVATASDGAVSLIHHEKNGLLTPIDDPIAMAQQIKKVLEDESIRKDMVENARYDYEKYYAEQPVVELWKAFMTKVANN